MIRGQSKAFQLPSIPFVAWTAAAFLHLLPLPDTAPAQVLSVTKEARVTCQAGLFARAVIEYTVAVGNTTRSPVVLRVEDPIPQGTTYQLGSATGGATYNGIRNQMEWQGVLLPGTALVLTFAVATDPLWGTPAMVENTVFVIPAEGATPTRAFRTDTISCPTPSFTRSPTPTRSPGTTLSPTRTPSRTRTPTPSRNPTATPTPTLLGCCQLGPAQCFSPARGSQCEGQFFPGHVCDTSSGRCRLPFTPTRTRTATPTRSTTATPTATATHTPARACFFDVFVEGLPSCTPTASPTPTLTPTATPTELSTDTSTPGRITITFAPRCTRECDRIDWIQVVCETATLKNGSRKAVRPAHYDVGGNHFGFSGNTADGRTVNVAASPTPDRFCWVDRLDNKKVPYYGQDNGYDSGGAAKSGAHNSTLNPNRKTWMTDRPTLHDRVDPASGVHTCWEALDQNLGGTVETITDEFEACVFCREGKDQGTIYGCVTWTDTFKRPADSAGPAATEPGAIASGTVSSKPSDAWKKAANAATGQFGNYPNGPDVQGGKFK
ncbi:MAG: hypothetical protein KatS3mg077_2009 [Candidatus Binatia bacterium]|nr:MAG: hypothetical protein KatS3mg077_2009 [Candidatus Binatia bacterium]